MVPRNPGGVNGIAGLGSASGSGVAGRNGGDRGGLGEAPGAGGTLVPGANSIWRRGLQRGRTPALQVMFPQPVAADDAERRSRGKPRGLDRQRCWDGEDAQDAALRQHRERAGQEVDMTMRNLRVRPGPLRGGRGGGIGGRRFVPWDSGFFCCAGLGDALTQGRRPQGLTRGRPRGGNFPRGFDFRQGCGILTRLGDGQAIWVGGADWLGRLCAMGRKGR